MNKHFLLLLIKLDLYIKDGVKDGIQDGCQNNKNGLTSKWCMNFFSLLIYVG